ncbi:MAG: sprE [Chitinophagaceae bacterium]|nr:sprE [Chitinophagaceae bacterium]
MQQYVASFIHRAKKASALLLIAAVYLSLSGCSQNNNSFVAVTYHNLLARDNSFFLARERMKDVEKTVYDQRQDNFNEILEVIPPFDSTKTKSITQLDDVIKKASMPIRRHKNSMYVDDSYILVGRCRMYKADFKLGMETYKFVNHSSPENEEKGEAMIYLMRAYMAQNEYDNAFTVSEYIEKLNPQLRKNKREFHLTRAQYYRHFEEYDKCVEDLNLALPNIRKKDPKSRTHFILGQIYQENGNDTLAYKHYKKVLKLNPPFDFAFYTKLYMVQVGHFNNKSKKEVDKYFKKLLADEKNSEYKDKIYYEMARYEIKQKNYAGGEQNLKKALQNKGSNKHQTASSYLAMGELYFEKLNNFQLAKVYYDSAVMNWDTKHKRYKEISKRHKILTELAEQTEIIHRNDSLLTLAAMDSVALNKFVDRAIERDIAAAKKKAEEEKKRKNRTDDFNFTGLPNDANSSPTSTFYFSNPGQVSQGYSDFLRTWGKRKNEDNWRRAKKEDPVVDLKTPDPADTSATAQATKNASDLKDTEADAAPKVDRSTYFKDIPFTPEAKTLANTEIKDAQYKLGKIYDFKLYLKDSAVTAFKKQIKRYPGNDHEPEELYLMYLIAKEKPDAKLLSYSKNELYTKHPNSTYTKLIDNPNYLIENKTNSKKAAILYKDTYTYYTAKDTAATDSLIASYYITYPDGTSIDDKFALLNILNELNKKADRKPLADSLDLFIEHYKSSKLVGYAENIRDQITGKKNETPKEAVPVPEVPVVPLEEKPKELPTRQPDGLLNPPADEK